MKEYLKVVSETLNNLNNEKKTIESKTVKTQADIEEIEEIDRWFQETVQLINEWMSVKEQNQTSYQNREEVFVFEDSSTNDEFKELGELINEGIEEENKVDQTLQKDKLIDEGSTELDVAEETNEFGILNEVIYKGMKEQNQSKESTDQFKEVNNLINSGMLEEAKEESNKNSVPEETEKENIKTEKQAFEEELGAMLSQEVERITKEQESNKGEFGIALRQELEEKAEEKKEKPLKNFVTKIKKRISLPEKLNKENVVSGMKNFCKKCVPSFMRKKESDMSTEELVEQNEFEDEINLENENSANTYEELLPRDLNVEYLDEDFLSDFEEEASLGIIGSTASIYEGTRVHNNAFDAYMGKNSYPTYYNNDDERVVIGVAIVNDNGIHAIYANEEDYKERIDLLLATGGDVVSVLTANKKYLSDWDGKTPLLWAEIQAYKEGWYNINDISNKNMKGLSR